MDIIGKKFNLLTIIEYKQTSNNGGKCKCLCDCGNYIELDKSQVVKNRKKSCGCLKQKDVTNKKFGMLTVLEKSDKKGNDRSTYLLCRCDCGSEKIIQKQKVTSGLTKSCGCLKNKLKKYEENFGTTCANRVITTYKSGAKRRKLLFILSLHEMFSLFNGNCFYCGVEPKQISKLENNKGEFIYNGIDRKDNLIGYTKDNCVSCCSICNRMKMNMNEEDFINHCNRISKYRT